MNNFIKNVQIWFTESEPLHMCCAPHQLENTRQPRRYAQSVCGWMERNIHAVVSGEMPFEAQSPKKYCTPEDAIGTSGEDLRPTGPELKE